MFEYIKHILESLEKRFKNYYELYPDVKPAKENMITCNAIKQNILIGLTNYSVC